MRNDKNERIARALEWAKERKLGSKQLNLFDREYIKQLNKASKREKKLTEKVKNKEKFKEICQGIRGDKAKGELSEKEFKEMCKKARVDRASLCKTKFTESLKSS